MIAINLIPAELRKTDSTPLPRRLTIFGAVAGNAVGLVVALTYFFGTIPSLQTEKQSLQSQIYQATTINKVQQRYNELNSQKRDFEQRRNTIESIQKARVLWALKLDQLWDLIPADMWLTDIELENPAATPKNRGQQGDEKPQGQTLVIEGYTAGPEHRARCRVSSRRSRRTLRKAPPSSTTSNAWARCNWNWRARSSRSMRKKWQRNSR